MIVKSLNLRRKTNVSIMDERFDNITVDGVRIWRSEIIPLLDYHLHNIGYVTEEQLQDLGNSIIHDIVQSKKTFVKINYDR
jgi:hypothetical protein